MINWLQIIFNIISFTIAGAVYIFIFVIFDISISKLALWKQVPIFISCFITYGLILIIEEKLLSKYKKNFREELKHDFSFMFFAILIISFFNLLPTAWHKYIQFIMLALGGLVILWWLQLIIRILTSGEFNKWECIISSIFCYISCGLFFAGLYNRLPASIQDTSSPIDYIYVSFIALSTSGLGNIKPSGLAKLFVSIENILGLFIVAVIISSAVNLPTLVRKYRDK